ncbi:MAG TPA: DUF3426 domain-containing protein [Oxalicibacterium sp.]
MALATKCPHCQTTFRVAHDQLKLRAGLVRCGHCKEIFNGIEHLLPPEKPGTKNEVAPAVSPMPAAEVVSQTTSEQIPEAVPQDEQDDIEETHEPVEDKPAADESATDDRQETSSPEENAAVVTPPASRLAFEIPSHFEREFPAPVKDDAPVDPLQRMTLMDFAADTDEDGKEVDGEQRYSRAEAGASAFDPHAPDELDEAIEDLQRKPWRRSIRNKNKAKQEEENDELDEEETHEAAEEEPSFIKHGRRRQRLGRKLRNFLIAGSCILFAAAVLQGIYVFRNQLGGLFPQVKPLLTQACDVIGCNISLPAQISAVSIESSELQTIENNGDMFVLTTLLRNNSTTPQEWPHIELTLNDGNEKPLLRRVFRPSDYVANEEIRQGFGPSSERTTRIAFQLEQVKASGYRVYLFYP